MAIVKFWGVRGSIPTPGPTTVRYGGNTACVELRHKDNLFILDAGSGLRLLGKELLKINSAIKASIFISHMHWDHIQGIPFFTPAFIPGNKFIFFGAEESDSELANILAKQMDPTYFPIELGDMRSKLEFRRLFEGSHEIDGIRVETIFLNHPGQVLGYRFYFDDKSIVYISDNEPFAPLLGPVFNGNGYKGETFIGEDGNGKLIDFIEGADLLIHDAQYTPEEYQSHITWGHSPYDYTVNIGLNAGVKKLFLFHHDPLHDDEQVDDILKEARGIVGKRSGSMEVFAASEGMAIDL